MDGIRAAIERKTVSGRVLNADECIAPEAALYAYTAAPAFATRTERDRGTISRGKWADFTVLSHHPARLSVNEWDGITVDATYVAGECLYTRE
jgi:predicted amidohydrolase YtcJ